MMYDAALARPVRHLSVDQLQDEPPAPAPGCARPLLAGFLATVVIGMAFVPGVAAAVLGWN